MTIDTNTSSRQYSRRAVLRTGAVTVATTAGVGATTSSVAASSGMDGGILADGLEGTFDRRAFASGYASRYQNRFGRPDSIEDLADNARNEFRSYADAWIDYGNYLLEEADVVALGSAEIGVTFELTRGRWPFSNPDPVETTVLAEYDEDADEFVDLDWVTGPPDDPDYQFTLANWAAENAHLELIDFRRQWIDVAGDDHQLPDAEYLNALAGQYWDFISLGEDEKSVIELLLGEVSV